MRSALQRPSLGCLRRLLLLLAARAVTADGASLRVAKHYMLMCVQGSALVTSLLCGILVTWFIGTYLFGGEEDEEDPWTAYFPEMEPVTTTTTLTTEAGMSPLERLGLGLLVEAFIDQAGAELPTPRRDVDCVDCVVEFAGNGDHCRSLTASPPLSDTRVVQLLGEECSPCFRHATLYCQSRRSCTNCIAAFRLAEGCNTTFEAQLSIEEYLDGCLSCQMRSSCESVEDEEWLNGTNSSSNETSV